MIPDWINKILAEAQAFEEPIPVRGCTEAEIAHIEDVYGYPLPTSIKDFYRHMGRKLGNVLGSSGQFYPHMFVPREWILEQKADIGYSEEEREWYESNFPLDSFFIYNYEWEYYICSLGANREDPPVYFIEEMEQVRKKVADHFSEFIYSAWQVWLESHRKNLQLSREHIEELRRWREENNRTE